MNVARHLHVADVTARSIRVVTPVKENYFGDKTDIPVARQPDQHIPILPGFRL